MKDFKDSKEGDILKATCEVSEKKINIGDHVRIIGLDIESVKVEKGDGTEECIPDGSAGSFEETGWNDTKDLGDDYGYRWRLEECYSVAQTGKDAMAMQAIALEIKAIDEAYVKKLVAEAIEAEEAAEEAAELEAEKD
jgi:hypothetical protein